MSGAGGRVLFATSNGTGLGHLNRAMAIARRLPAGFSSSIFTLSQAAPVVARAGFAVEYFPSYRRPASGSDWQWNLRLRRRLEDLLEAERPELVVFDGVHPYRALTHVLSARGAPPSVWCRRPLWRQGSPAAALRRVGAFDAVIEPGELAAEADRGATVDRRGEVIATAPMTYLDRGELLDRAAAAGELGLDPGRPTALVSLGQGGALDRAVARALRRLCAEPELQVAALQSSIAPDLEVPDGVVHLRATFPMSRYFRAFDLAVAAAGYNAFHELIAFAVPSLFVPMPRNTDDQAARARWAAAAGVGRAVEDPEDPGLEHELEVLLDPDERERLRAGCEQAVGANGAAEAAGVVAALARGEQPGPATRRRGTLNRWLRLSSHPIGPSLPLALGLTARDLLAHPERRRPRSVILAFGLDDEELGTAVAAELDRGDEPADRVLVITDGLDFAALRRLGVGFQRVRSAGELGVEAGGPEHMAALGRAVEAALAQWRGSWPARRLGEAARALNSPRLGGDRRVGSGR